MLGIGKKKFEAMQLIIIQPWFTGKGHPAQSLINTASAIGNDGRIDYLVSFDRNSTQCHTSMERLVSFGRVFKFNVNTQTGKSNTIRALISLVRLRLSGHRYQRIFFFDATLPVLALLWLAFSWLVGVQKLSVLHLQGPEVIGGGWLGRYFVKCFLKHSSIRLYLRTEELAQAWMAEYTGEIRYLPSLEIPTENDKHSEQCSESNGTQNIKVRFGIIGQIRPGKGIDKLVPIFQNNPSIGILTVAGTFFDDESRTRLSVLEKFEGFINRFLSEVELIQLSAEQDYLLMLYDEGWDPRLESAVLYLAARVNRPVVVYDKGWSGRKVREFGCGLLATENVDNLAKILKEAPHPGDDAYSKLLEGVAKFKMAHSAASLRGKVVRELVE